MKNQPTAENGTGVFQPDLLLPSQFFTALRGRSQGDGQRRLMIAVLEDAIECFQKYLDAKDSRGRQLGTEAEAWFLTDEPTWLFSFANVCETLDLNPAFLREGLLAWKTNRLVARPAEDATDSLLPDADKKHDSQHAA
ncbi:MAG: hypothetical protein HOP18_05245 [Deltaproteobacteria bacterium]|nr:hypothetical protein [Deltaproteobacteria bacterium]